jgi:hypothetical protein
MSSQKAGPGWACLLPLVAASVAAALPTGIAIAQQGQDREYPTAVATFGRLCLMPGVNPVDRLAAIEADRAWSEDARVSVDVPGMGVSKTIERNYSFAKVLAARQWSGDVDGQKVRLVLATFDAKARYPNLCALVLDGPRNAMPYGGALRAAFKTFGIGGKSVDLVHYYEFAGKVGPDKHPVRGEIFSRSLSGQSGQATHIYVAY